MHIADDINFGVELEFIIPSLLKNYYEAMDGLLSAIGEAGLPILEYRNSHLDKSWDLKKDETLYIADEDKRNCGRSDLSYPLHLHPFETTSPILSGTEGLLSVQKMLVTLAELGAFANESCGFHVHVSPKRESSKFQESEIRNFVASALQDRQRGYYHDMIDSSRHCNDYCSEYISTSPSVKQGYVGEAPFEQIVGNNKLCMITMARINRKSPHYNSFMETIEFRGKEASGFNENRGAEHIAYIGTVINFTAEAIKNPNASFKAAARHVVSGRRSARIPMDMRHTKPGLLAAKS